MTNGWGWKNWLGAIIALVSVSACDPHPRDVILDAGEPANPQPIEVLDGDTLVVGDTVIRLSGVVAPEMPPYSQCWAEAALAGHAKAAVERYVEVGNSGPSRFGGWRVADPLGEDENGHIIASLRSENGEDLADMLVVYGYAARTNEWDWCSGDNDFRNLTGPNLWYPPDDSLDERVVD